MYVVYFCVVMYLKSISLKIIYLSDINNKYFKSTSFVKKVIKRRLLVWYKATFRLLSELFENTLYNNKILHVTASGWQSRDRP